MTANQGAMGNGINIATRGNTEANLGPLVDGSGTVSVSQNMYYFVNANLAGSKGVAIATISTNADGSTVITPSVVTKTNQTIGAITFAPTTLAVGGTTTASATATSLLPVSFSSTTPATCSVTGSTVSGVAAGLCTIVADQAGDLNWNAAPQVTQNITVLATQAIGPFTFTPPNLTAGKTTTVSATASSSLPVTFASTTTPSICTTSGTNGTTVTGLLAGVCTITADQPGDAAFAAAPQISHNINVIAPFIRINSNVTAENTLTGALAAPTANATIDIQAAPVFVENVVMNNPVTINLNGGYNTLFNPQAGVFTTIQGSLTIRNGTLRVSQIAIK